MPNPALVVKERKSIGDQKVLIISEEKILVCPIEFNQFIKHIVSLK
jgi:hypothetical protein